MLFRSDACNKAARRAMIELTEKDYNRILNDVWESIEENYPEDTDIEIYDMHNIVEAVLENNYIKMTKKYKKKKK